MTVEAPVHVDPTREAMALFRDLPGDRPIAMINLLRFRTAAGYPSDHADADKDRTGAEAYAAYGRAAAAPFARAGGRQLWLGRPEITLIGPADEIWDRVLLRLGDLGITDAGPVAVDTGGSAPAAAAAGPRERMIDSYSAALLACAERDPRIVALDADLILDTGLIPFRERFPERFVECGIAEQDMVSQACGLAIAGMLPVANSFACFLTPRANEQIYNAATERRKIVYMGSLAGLIPAGPGHSHQGTRDIAVMGSMPHMTVVEPGFAAECEALTRWCLEENTAGAYIRLCPLPVERGFDIPAGYSLRPGRGTTLREGTDAVLFAYGPIFLAEALKAAALCADAGGPSVRVVDLPWLNSVDPGWLGDAVAGFEHVFVLDNHFPLGGLGGHLGLLLGALSTPPRLHHFAVEGIPACGRNDEVLARHRLDSGSLAARIRTGLG